MNVLSAQPWASMMLSTAAAKSSTFLGLADGDWATVAPSVVAVLAAIFAWIQAQRATRQDSYGTIASMLQDMNRIFLERPTLRGVFFGNVDKNSLTEADDKERVEAITPYLLNVYEAIWSFKPQMGRTERGAWRLYIRDQLKKDSILRLKYNTDSKYYPNLVKLMKKQP